MENEDIQEIYRTYSNLSKLNISKEEKEKINTAFKENNIDVTIFNEAANEIYKQAVSIGPLKDRILLFAQAIIYKKRISKQDGDLPDQLFIEGIESYDNIEWKEFHNKKACSVSRMNVYNGFYIKETAIIQCPIEDAFDIMWDVTRRHEWTDIIIETRPIEKIGSRTEIYYTLVQLATKQSEYCLFQSKKLFPNGDIVIVGCSVDHKDAPFTDKIERGSTPLFMYFLQSISKDSCRVSGKYMVDLSAFGKINQIIFKSEWCITHFICKLPILKKILEKKKKATKKGN